MPNKHDINNITTDSCRPLPFNTIIRSTLCKLDHISLPNRPVATIFRGEDANFKKRDQKFNVAMIGHTNSEDARVLRGSRGMLPWENFEILAPQACLRTCQIMKELW